MSALQSRPAIQVAPVVFVTQTIVPVALAPLLFGERFSATPLGGRAAERLARGADRGRGDAGALAAADYRFMAVRDAGRELVSDASGSAPSPEEPSQATIRSSPSTDAEDPSSSTTSTSPARIAR